MTTVLPGGLPLLEHVEQPDLAARVERVGRLVEQQDLRVHREHARDGDALLLAAGQRVGRAVEQRRDAQLLGDGRDALAHVVLGEAELQRAERELVEGGVAEQLDVGVLEDEAHAAAELAAKRRVLERVLGERVPERRDRASRGEHEAVEHLEQRGLARAVRAGDGDVLAGLDRQVDAGQRRDCPRGTRGGRRRARTRESRSSRAHHPVDAEQHGAREDATRRATPSRARWSRSRTSEGIAPEKPRASMAS